VKVRSAPFGIGPVFWTVPATRIANTTERITGASLPLHTRIVST